MPIRESERERYPKDWPAISRRIRERAGNKCEFCDVANGALGGRDAQGTFWLCTNPDAKPKDVAWCVPPDSPQGDYLRIIRIVLTVAHLNHTPEDCSDENLKALCQRCHLIYDAEHHAANAKATRRAAINCGDLFE